MKAQALQMLNAGSIPFLVSSQYISESPLQILMDLVLVVLFVSSFAGQVGLFRREEHLVTT
jgi:hypothetical protein